MTPAVAVPVLEVRDLAVEFVSRHGALRALDGISFSIRRGEIFGVVGESGAGKSLTGAAIVGLIDPPGRIAGGSIHLSGTRLDTLSREPMRRMRGRHVGMIFQDPLTSLDPLQTVGAQLVETIRTHLKLSARPARDRAVALLDEVGIPAAAQRLGAYPHEFSGGMRQRVVIALALAGGPELVIADEPTTALDVSVQAQIVGLLMRLCRDHGVAVMLITHDMGVIAEAADRVAVLYAGRVAEIGPVRSIITAPAHPYSQGLIGAIPSLRQSAPRLTQIAGAMPRLGQIPAACAFAPRCPSVFARCRQALPPLYPAGATEAACFLLAPETVA